jgi:hypothetical protein
MPNGLGGRGSNPGNVQTGSGVHRAYQVSIGGSFLGMKQPECKGDQSPLSNAEVKNGRATSPLPSRDVSGVETEVSLSNFKCSTKNEIQGYVRGRL